jgi:hypothetical protein
MAIRNWSKSEVEYGRKVFSSGLAGARTGGEAFLKGRPLTPFLSKAVRNASTPAAVGAVLGVLSSYPGNRQRFANRAFTFGVLGWAVGLSLSIAWQSRGLTASVASGALRNIGRARDEHWLERNPIDYA